MYEIEFSKEAVKHVLVMRKSSPHLFKKLEKLLDELREHPYTGTGHPEQLKFLQGGPGSLTRRTESDTS